MSIWLRTREVEPSSILHSEFEAIACEFVGLSKACGRLVA